MADRPLRRRRRAPAPWWLSEGSERCPYCLDRYHDEMELRCAGCDGPLCPDCALRTAVRRQVLCPSCRPAAAAAAGERR